MKNPHWQIIHVGYLAGNPYWDEETECRKPLCTSTLVQSGNRRILIDPGGETCEQFEETLFCYSGLQPRDIDTIFLTHFHTGHKASLSLFARSLWLMSRVEIHWWQEKPLTLEHEKDLLARIVPFEEHSIPGIDIMPTPGHTHGSASLTFETREGIVVAAGDAIATFDHFDDRLPIPHSEDEREALRSINRIAKMADVIIPGHGNYFVV